MTHCGYQMKQSIFLTLSLLLLWSPFNSVFGIEPEELKSIALQSQDGVIELTNTNFDYLTSGPRTNYMVIYFTALSSTVNCKLCQDFEKDFRLVSRSWNQDRPGSSDLIFAIADVANNQKSFAKVGLTDVPHIWMYQPGEEDITGTLGRFQLPLADDGNDVRFADWLGKIHNTTVTLHKPFDYQQFVTYFVGTLGAIILIRKRAPVIAAKLSKSRMWCFLSCITVVLFTSGYMFTVIRGVPFVMKGDKGDITYITGGHSYQIAIETFLVGSVYSVCAGLVAALVFFIPKLSNENIKSLAVIASTAFLLIAYSYLVSLFHVKDPGYPYWLIRLPA